MTWQSVGTHTFVPTDKAVQVGSFDLAAGQDTIWVKITQLNNPGDWPWSYGILSWRNANGTPLGSIKAYSNRLGEVFRLGNGLAPLDGVGSIWFEPRGFNLGWLKAGFPWELSFEAQAGASDLTSGYWNRDPQSGLITPKTSGDNLDMTPGWIKAKNLILTDGTGATNSRDVGGYQEGSWVPVSLNGGLGSFAHAHWARSGNTVTFQAYLSDVGAGGTASGAIKFGGFPYLETPNLSSLGCCMTNAWATEASVAFVAGSAVSFFRSVPGQGWQELKAADRLNAGSSIWFQATYFTQDTTWKPANNAALTSVNTRYAPAPLPYI